MIAELRWPAAIVAAMLGLLLGSFLNVCIYRVPRDLSVVAPRSFCPECGAPVAWYDNFPLLSFFVLRAKCRECRQPIPWRYPIVELSAAVLFGASVWRYGLTLSAAKCVLFEAMMIVLFWTDVEENILPDEFTIGGSLAGFALAFFVPVSGIFDLFFMNLPPPARSSLNSITSGAMFALPFWAVARVYERIRQPEALGLGDIKLIACLGIFLGLEGELLALLIGTVSGAIFGIVYVLLTRRDWRTSTLPFGSFLCAGAALSALL